MDPVAAFNQQFGKRIKFLREAHDPYLSQERAAHEAGYAVSSWSRLERGIQSCHVQKIPDIARVLGVSIDALFQFPDKGSNQHPDQR